MCDVVYRQSTKPEHAKFWCSQGVDRSNVATWISMILIDRRKVLGCHLWRHATCRWPHRWIAPCHPPSNSSALIWKKVLNGFMIYCMLIFDGFFLSFHGALTTSLQFPLDSTCPFAVIMLQSLNTMASVYYTVIKETWRIHPYKKMKTGWLYLFDHREPLGKFGEKNNWNL